MSNIICFEQTSYDFVVSKFTSHPLPCLNIDPADTMRASAFLQVDDDTYINILKNFYSISPRK